MNWVTPVLVRCGAKVTFVSNETVEPTNEQEFQRLEFQSDSPITWEMYQAKRDEYQLERGLKQIRQKRNTLLQESDWVTIPVTWDRLQNKTEWETYRQDLRDLPEKVSLSDFFWTGLHRLDFSRIPFPTKPNVVFIQPTQESTTAP